MMATRESPAFGTQAAPARTEPVRGVDLSIVIPAFNEEERLPASLGAVSAYLAARPSAPRIEVLVVDDGSSDATASRAEDAGRRHGLDLRVLRLPKNRGKGFAVRTGCLEAAGRLILVSDADFSTPIYEWEKLASANAPVAIGSRAIDESLVKERQALPRRTMGKLFNRLVRLVAVPGIRDTQCGFKLFSREAGAGGLLASEGRPVRVRRRGSSPSRVSSAMRSRRSPSSGSTRPTRASRSSAARRLTGTS